MQLRSRARLRSQVCATELIVMPHDGRQGIRVNCVVPGHLYTPIGAQAGAEMRDLRRAGLLGTEGDASDVAWAAVFWPPTSPPTSPRRCSPSTPASPRSRRSRCCRS